MGYPVTLCDFFRGLPEGFLRDIVARGLLLLLLLLDSNFCVPVAGGVRGKTAVAAGELLTDLAKSAILTDH